MKKRGTGEKYLQTESFSIIWVFLIEDSSLRISFYFILKV